MTLYEKLQRLSKSDMLPLHMPGHKRSHYIANMSEIYDIDITEIDGFDDLHHPEGILADMETQAAELYGAERAFLSVGGSSAANQAAVMAACNACGKILVDRGCHKSVYFAIELGNLNPVYIKPEYDPVYRLGLPVRNETVREALKANPGCGAVVITSPTYEGFTADIESIAETVHSYGALLIVDAAHGAHIGFGAEKTDNPISRGADMAVVSLHKLLPAPTQTALLLVGNKNADEERLKHYMSVFQSSSPSYVLMAGIGECLRFMEEDGLRMLEAGRSALQDFRAAMKDLKFITVNVSEELESPECGHDPYKVIIASKTPDISGRSIYDRLRADHHIQCEMYAERYALAMFSLMDTPESYSRLKKALISMDDEIGRMSVRDCYSAVDCADSYAFDFPEMECTPGEAMKQPYEMSRLDGSICGRVSAGYAMAYPPGIPMIVPGEVYSAQILGYIENGMKKGLHIIGVSEDMKVLTVKNEGKDNMPDGQEFHG